MKRISKEGIIKLGIIAVLLIVIIVMTAMLYANDKNPLVIDTIVRDFAYKIRGEKGGVIYWITRIVTELGDKIAVIGIILLIGILTKFDERFFLIAFVGITMYFVNSGFKHIVLRERPIEELRWQYESSTSFPSGHSASAGSMYTMLLILTLKSNLNDKIKLAAKIGFPIIILVVMFTRLILGVHYFSDVLAGASVGAIIALGYSFLMDPAKKVYNICLNKIKELIKKEN